MGPPRHWLALGAGLLALAASPGCRAARGLHTDNQLAVPEKTEHHRAHHAHRGAHQAADLLEADEAELVEAPGAEGAAPGELVSEWTRLQHRAAQGEGEELPQGDGCAAVLNVPKVALMFFMRGVMPHERTWELWFRNARGLLPRAALQGMGCSDGMVEALSQVCNPDGEAPKGRGPIQEQHLANVYLHVDAKVEGFQGFAAGSIWHGLDIKERVSVDWGGHTQVDAMKALLKAALQEPANVKFALLSESDVPLYPLQTVWIELLWEAKSRIAACEATSGWNRERWHPEMEEEAGITLHNFRKTSTWFALNRKHVETAVNDTAVSQAFRTSCTKRYCNSDEHYFSTLLAMKDMEEETDCKGELMHTVWRGLPGTPEHAHPVSWPKEEITPDLFREMRQTQPAPLCNATAAVASTAGQFFNQSQLATGQGLCAASAAPYSGTLGNDCTLFARKFAPATVETVRDVLLDCKNELYILNTEESCRQDR